MKIFGNNKNEINFTNKVVLPLVSNDSYILDKLLRDDMGEEESIQLSKYLVAKNIINNTLPKNKIAKLMYHDYKHIFQTINFPKGDILNFAKDVYDTMRLFLVAPILHKANDSRSVNGYMWKYGKKLTLINYGNDLYYMVLKKIENSEKIELSPYLNIFNTYTQLNHLHLENNYMDNRYTHAFNFINFKLIQSLYRNWLITKDINDGPWLESIKMHYTLFVGHDSSLAIYNKDNFDDIRIELKEVMDEIENYDTKEMVHLNYSTMFLKLLFCIVIKNNVNRNGREYSVDTFIESLNTPAIKDIIEGVNFKGEIGHPKEDK